MRIVGLASLALVVGLTGRAAVAEETALPAAVIAEGMRTAECDEPANADSVIDTSDLGGGQSLVEVRCLTGAYQGASIFFVMPAGAPERARLLRFPEPSKDGFTSSPSLNGPEFDPATRIMRSLYKGRGVGDCGTIGEWKWAGADFKLARY